MIDTIRDGEASGLPTVQGRLAYKGTCFWLEKKTFEVGLWGHYAQEHLDSTPAPWTEDDFDSTATGFDVTLPLLDFLDVRGEAWQGKNLDDIRGGICQGVSSIDGGTEIESRGYWAEVLVKPMGWYTLCVGTSRDNPVNGDVTTAAALPTTGAEDNHVYYIANRINAGGGLMFGLDVLHWVTKWRGGDLEGDDHRVNFFVAYHF